MLLVGFMLDTLHQGRLKDHFQPPSASNRNIIFQKGHRTARRTRVARDKHHDCAQRDSNRADFHKSGNKWSIHERESTVTMPTHKMRPTCWDAGRCGWTVTRNAMQCQPQVVKCSEMSREVAELGKLSHTAAEARTQPENSKRAHFRALALQKLPKFHEKTPREKEEKAQNFGPPTLRAPSGPPPFGAPPFWAPPFGAPRVEPR